MAGLTRERILDVLKLNFPDLPIEDLEIWDLLIAPKGITVLTACGKVLPDRSLVEVWQLGADGAIQVCKECAKEPDR